MPRSGRASSASRRRYRAARTAAALHRHRPRAVVLPVTLGVILWRWTTTAGLAGLALALYLRLEGGCSQAVWAAVPGLAAVGAAFGWAGYPGVGPTRPGRGRLT